MARLGNLRVYIWVCQHNCQFMCERSFSTSLNFNRARGYGSKDFAQLLTTVELERFRQPQ